MSNSTNSCESDFEIMQNDSLGGNNEKETQPLCSILNPGEKVDRPGSKSQSIVDLITPKNVLEEIENHSLGALSKNMLLREKLQIKLFFRVIVTKNQFHQELRVVTSIQAWG